MEENKPLVSVILTCYNRENYIRRSLESIINQTYTNLEIVVVDDCSTDNSVEIIKSYNDKRIKLICLDVNGGIGIAKKTGGDNSNGEYLCFLDSDDYYMPEYVELNINKATSGNHDIILGRKYLKYGNSNPIVEFPYTYNRLAYQAINAMFLRRDLYNNISFSELRLFEDRGTLPRLVYHTKNLGLIPISPYVWVFNRQSAVFGSNISKSLFYINLSMIENIEYFKKVNPEYKLPYSIDKVLYNHNTRIIKYKDELKEKYPEDWNKYITYINSLTSNSE